MLGKGHSGTSSVNKVELFSKLECRPILLPSGALVSSSAHILHLRSSYLLPGYWSSEALLVLWNEVGCVTARQTLLEHPLHQGDKKRNALVDRIRTGRKSKWDDFTTHWPHVLKPGACVPFFSPWLTGLL